MRRVVSVVGVLVGLLALSAIALLLLLRGDGIRIALEPQASSWLGQPVRIRGARPRILPRVGLHLEDVRIGAASEISLANVDVATGLRPLLSRRIQDAELVVSDSRLTMPLPFRVFAGNGTAA